jgi:hypothetical protein
LLLDELRAIEAQEIDAEATTARARVRDFFIVELLSR